MPIHIVSNKSKEIDIAVKPHVGTQVMKDGRLYGDKRCKLCGDWITWADVEPEYCFEGSVCRKTSGSGKEQCLDFYEMMLQAQTVRADKAMERAEKLTRILQKRGVMA